MPVLAYKCPIKPSLTTSVIGVETTLGREFEPSKGGRVWASEILPQAAATTAVVAGGKRYCYDRDATPQHRVLLGACLPGSAEISREEYDARP